MTGVLSSATTVSTYDETESVGGVIAGFTASATKLFVAMASPYATGGIVVFDVAVRIVVGVPLKRTRTVADAGLAPWAWHPVKPSTSNRVGKNVSPQSKLFFEQHGSSFRLRSVGVKQDRRRHDRLPQRQQTTRCIQQDNAALC